VLSGLGGHASADRLATFLSHSGGVILLQQSEFSYHFSSRLIPWVHYVPLTYTASDIVEKILWLREHDDLAKRIADNAKAFAKSYLRLEDHICYVATALDTLAQMYVNSTATEPFASNPRRIDFK
jgi:hypothetical protein